MTRALYLKQESAKTDARAAEQTLWDGADALAVPITEAQCQQILNHLSLLERWNKAFNLSAVKDYGDMVCRHALDSLTVLPHLVDGTTLDIGTGAGFPGMVVAIMQPWRPCILLDSVGKKTRFCRQVVGELGLRNVTVVQARVEHFQAPVPVRNIVSRAFAALPVIAQHGAHLLAPGGRVVALKGPRAAGELAAFANDAIGGRKWLVRNYPVPVPGVRGGHVVVTLDSV